GRRRREEGEEVAPARGDACLLHGDLLEALARALRGAEAVLDRRLELLEAREEEALDDRLLRAEQVVERADRELRLARDLGHDGAVEAAPREDTLGGHENVLLVPRAIARPPRRRRRSRHLKTSFKEWS